MFPFVGHFAESNSFRIIIPQLPYEDEIEELKLGMR
jgi:hypothetical protein